MRQASLSIVPLRNTKCECACFLLYKCTGKGCTGLQVEQSMLTVPC